jgi:ABC-2 type transport system permease protein
MKLFKLVENEVIKIIFKKRLLVIFGILLVLISLFAYGQKYTAEKNKEKLSARIGITQSYDWRKLADQQIISMKHRLDNPYITEKDKIRQRIQIQQLQYYIDNNIDPENNSAAKFSAGFITIAISMFLPLLIILLVGDIVSGEAATGTIKLLLARSVPRWKILLSKYLAVLIMEIVILFITLVLSVVISGIFFGYGGWMNPVATGFRNLNGVLDISGEVNVPQWQFTIMVYALAYFVSITVGTISFMISVIVKSTSASIGIMMSTLIGGTFLSYFIADWWITRYLFMVNLQLPDYLTDSFHMIDGITMTFSVIVLGVWTLAALAVSFVYFKRQDIYV